MPRLRQHGVWSILFARHENVILAQGAHTIRSGISVKSVFFGSHILSMHVTCVMPFLMQHPRISEINLIVTLNSVSCYVDKIYEKSACKAILPGRTGTTATLDGVPMPESNVNVRMRSLGRLLPFALLAVTVTEYMVNCFRPPITADVALPATVACTSDEIFSSVS